MVRCGQGIVASFIWRMVEDSIEKVALGQIIEDLEYKKKCIHYF